MARGVRVNKANTNLPNGFYYPVNANVVLSDDEFARLAFDVFSSGTLTDLGQQGVAGQQVTTQGAHVALTSSQIAAAPTQANYNALQADVAAIVASLSGAGKAMA
jgi:hypothetical protein